MILFMSQRIKNSVFYVKCDIVNHFKSNENRSSSFNTFEGR